MRYSVLAIAFLLSGCAALKDNWLPYKHTEAEIAAREKRETESLLDRVSFVLFSKAYPETKTDAVMVMTGAPTGKYVEIGLLKVEGLPHRNGREASQETGELANLMKMKAAKVGANAIVKFEMKDLVAESRDTGLSIGTGNRSDDSSDRRFRYQTQLSGVAVKYLPN